MTLWGVSTHESYACTCEASIMILKLKLLEGRPSGAPLEWYKSYPGAIFTGKVLKVKKEKAGTSASSVYRVRVDFEVERYW